MRAAWLFIICFTALSCREIRPFEPFEPVEGYLLEGTVTTSNGIPVDSVSVRLYYTYEAYQSSPLDTVEFDVPDSTKIVFVAVYTPDDRFVKRLFFGYRRPGPLPRYYWDERDDSGRSVSSGRYLIRYVYDTLIIKDVPWLTEGHETARTDAGGRFAIDNEHFPIGVPFDFFDHAGTYGGTYAVLPEVTLVLVYRGLGSPFSIVMVRNTVTHGAFTLR